LMGVPKFGEPQDSELRDSELRGSRELEIKLAPRRQSLRWMQTWTPLKSKPDPRKPARKLGHPISTAFTWTNSGEPQNSEPQDSELRDSELRGRR